jgi:hypothetical protein
MVIAKFNVKQRGSVPFAGIGRELGQKVVTSMIYITEASRLRANAHQKFEDTISRKLSASHILGETP